MQNLQGVSSPQKPQDYVKKIAVYRDRLAVQLPDKARFEKTRPRLDEGESTVKPMSHYGKRSQH